MFLDFFHLREQPFAVTLDPDYLYPSRTHCEALDALTESILGDRGFMALIAEPGMGKTTLLYQVLDRLRDKARVAFLFQTQCNSREFYRYLLRELGVDSTGMGVVAMHSKLDEMLFAEMLAGRRFVLLVDEAQNLDARVLETIRLLSNFETPTNKLLQIVLAGQPQLGDKLRQKHLSQLLQRLTIVKHLEPLSPEETAGYIRHRLNLAGHTGEVLFEQRTLSLIAERSHGVPRNINSICFRALSEAYARGRHTVTPNIVEELDPEFEALAAGRPSPIRASSPSTAGSDILRSVRVVTSPQLTYKPLSQFSSSGWGLSAIVLVLVLLSVASIRDDKLRELMLLMRDRMTAISRLMLHEEWSNLPETRGFQVAVQKESVEPEPNEPKLNAFSMRASILTNDELLDWARLVQNRDQVGRLVLDAKGAKDNSSQVLSRPPRPIIEIRPQSAAGASWQALPAHEIPVSISRELGLKINRIAIDPGHGGYDTGTLGPHGLLEKDLCLDVALRLGQMIEENILDTEVVYTRKDDSHVPLEERTAIANSAKADLFISIHANSSNIRNARGVETFYLGLTNLRENGELASRENVLGQASLHQFPELINKITRNEKATESQLFAADLQNSLSQRLQLVSRGEKNRGVKSAPFLVLTGANMPAVLSEISFVSNVNDESLLLESGQRQRVAEGLYRGVADYLKSLHSLGHKREKPTEKTNPGPRSWEVLPAEIRSGRSR